eukprot:1715865-Prymnesium_polylepis.1
MKRWETTFLAWQVGSQWGISGGQARPDRARHQDPRARRLSRLVPPQANAPVRRWVAPHFLRGRSYHA